MSAIASTPGALRLFALSIVARLPLTTFSIALLVHVQHLTGSLALAGVITGVYAASLGVGGPLLGRRVDRRGQTAVLLASAGTAAALLIALAVLPTGAPFAVIVGLATGTGLATPPLGACVRALFPALLPDRAAVRAAYAVDATASELTWVSGPPLALTVGAVFSTGAALAAGGLVLMVTTAAFAAQPASRGWQPSLGSTRPRHGSLGTPAMRTLVVVFIAVGILFGAAEVAVTAAAETLGSKSLAAPLLGLWGAGSLLGGVLNTRVSRGHGAGPGLAGVLIALTVGHLSLAVAAGNLYALGAGLLIAGAAIAPTYATIYAIVDRVAAQGTLTEAFTWLSTAVAIGGAIGAASGGAVASSAGPAAAFVLAGGAGALAVLVATTRLHTTAEPMTTTSAHADRSRPRRDPQRASYLAELAASFASSAARAAIRSSSVTRRHRLVRRAPVRRT